MSAGFRIQLFSSLSHDGMDELQRTLNWWLTLPDEDVAPIEDTQDE
jgi:hypothetical protein